MGKDMKPTAETPKLDTPKKAKKPKLSGQQRFSSVKDYLGHVEETLGKLHIETLSKGKR
jgi:hypothetical protein